MKRFVMPILQADVLCVTGFLLLADSALKCEHPRQSVVYAVTSSCGPSGNITVTSEEDSCEVVVTGAPAKVRGPIAGTGAEMWVNTNPGAYQDLARRYMSGLEPVS